MVRKIFVISVILLFTVSTILIAVSVKKYTLSLNGKNYKCSTLSNEDKKSLSLNAELISKVKKISADSVKGYEDKISECGTEKEYEISPELKKLIPPDVEELLIQYHETKPYSIKDFQECRRLWEDAKKESYDRWITENKKWEDYEIKLLTKNKCIYNPETK